MAVPDPLLPTDPPEPLPLPQPSNRRPKIICECCECEMSPTGDYLKLSEKAKGFRDQEERIGRFQEAIEELQKDVAAVTRERDEARALIPKKSSLW